MELVCRADSRSDAVAGAHHAGLRTASVGWPVSAGATDVDYLIPEYWRSASFQTARIPMTSS